MKRKAAKIFSSFMALIFTITVMPFIAIRVSADENVLMGGSSTTLSSGTYYVNSDVSYTGGTGQSALVIASGETVYIYVRSGATLTCTGGAGSGTAGGGAGIEVPSGATLYLLGEGTVNVTGGDAARGGNGGDGGHAYSTSGSFNLEGHVGTGGNGGNGGGGAGAGIGTRGGNGGSANAGNGSDANACGSIYIATSLVRTVNGGKKGSSGVQGTNGTGYINVTGDMMYYTDGAGGGSGGGGGAAADFGCGGTGGGAGRKGDDGIKAGYPYYGSPGTNGNTPDYPGSSLSVPQIDSVPTASSISYGQTLYSSILNGGEASVTGSFAWLDSSQEPAQGTASYDAVFTPSDMSSYVGLVTKVDVTAKYNQTVNPPAGISDLTYNGDAQQLISTPASVATGNTAVDAVSYALSADATTWVTDITQITGTTAGTYNVYYKVAGNDTYLDFVCAEPVSVTIDPIAINADSPYPPIALDTIANNKKIMNGTSK